MAYIKNDCFVQSNWASENHTSVKIPSVNTTETVRSWLTYNQQWCCTEETLRVLLQFLIDKVNALILAWLRVWT